MIRILDILAASRVRVYPLEKDVLLTCQETRPACMRDLKIICLLTNQSRQQKIKFGLCNHCGYRGYIDRPVKEWLVNFYKQKWDGVFSRNENEVKKLLNLPIIGPKASRYLTISLALSLNVDKSKPICEIGCGYGEVLKKFSDAGFKKLIGVENSSHRALMAKKVFDLEVITGDFGGIQVQEALRPKGPFTIIFSHHVLEHTYNPAEIIKNMAELQKQGDYLVLALPNAEGEHINYGLFYLVHLHVFTKESLELLLNKNGYEIIADHSPDETNIIIAAQKVNNPKKIYKLRKDYEELIKERLKRGLCINFLKAGSRNLVRWQQKLEIKDYAQNLPARFWFFKKYIKFIKARLLRRFSSGYEMLVEFSGQDFFLPLEINFKKDIKFLIK